MIAPRDDARLYEWVANLHDVELARAVARHLGWEQNPTHEHLWMNPSNGLLWAISLKSHAHVYRPDVIPEQAFALIERGRALGLKTGTTVYEFRLYSEGERWFACFGPFERPTSGSTPHIAICRAFVLAAWWFS